MLAQMGMNTWVRSWVPDCEIVGMAIRHGEAFGLSEKLTVWKNSEPIYRPTVNYAYMPCDETIVSLHELRCRNYEIQPKLRILKEKEIVSGADMLGALLMGHEYGSWWCGSILSIEEARKLAPGAERDHRTGRARRSVRGHVDDRASPGGGCALPRTCRTTTC